MTAPPSGRVLVLVGTDHHPFDRLVGWADGYAATRPGVDVLVQHGRSAAPRAARGKDFLAAPDVPREMAAADVVVSHGGPATLTEARRAGRLPLVVPRDPALGEHVDDHQQRFVRWLADRAWCRAAGDEAALHRMLDEALRSPETVRVAGEDGPDAAVDRFGRLVDRAATGRRPDPDAVPVLFLGGFGRSGSTLVERLLGSLPGVTSLGEVVHLWERGVRGDELCGCGQPFGGCDFWTKVGDRAFGGWDAVDVDRLLALKSRVDRQRRSPALVVGVGGAALRRDAQEYGEHFARVYAAAAEVSGAEVVVDASKHPSLATVLSLLPEVDLRVLHLVRDSRAVAYSWSTQVRRPEVVDGDEYMPTFSPLGSSALWTSNNALVSLLRMRRVPVRRVRYEDVVAGPRAALAPAADLLRPLGPDALDALPAGTAATLSPGHSVAGNPMRFTTGEVRLRRDERWRSEMPARDRRTVAALTWPLRARYGYRGRS